MKAKKCRIYKIHAGQGIKLQDNPANSGTVGKYAIIISGITIRVTMMLIRIRNASQVVLVCSGRENVLKGDTMKNLAILEQDTSCRNGGGLTIAVDQRL